MMIRNSLGIGSFIRMCQIYKMSVMCHIRLMNGAYYSAV